MFSFSKGEKGTSADKCISRGEVQGNEIYVQVFINQWDKVNNCVYI